MSAGGRLDISGLTHRYGSQTALRNVDLTVESGQLVTFLGPSGCGKTTLLRSIAGFIRPSEGRIVLDGTDITRMPPHRREVNMVFQRPTLFPHLNVRDNVAFGLKLKRVSRKEADHRVDEMLNLVRLEGYGDRRNHELSGGQMQRVALARALVNQPRVLLLDEPLSALDLTIRLELEAELRRLHRETEATFVYVTHDQGEALALADRVAVFSTGQIDQVGSPRDIYFAPESAELARFVGDANVLPGEVDPAGGAAVGGVSVPITPGAAPGPAWLVVRQESVTLELVREGKPANGGLHGEIADVAFRGGNDTYRVECAGLPQAIKVLRRSGDASFAIGDRVTVSWPREAVRALPQAPGGVLPRDKPGVESKPE